MSIEKDFESRYRDALRKCFVRYRSMASGATLSQFIEEAIAGVDVLALCKLNRWLGYIQGSLIAVGKTDVQTERDWTRPLFKPLDSKILG